jgi:sugar O-acyltransferase (sialic acid O-acetyltransferase NeuD family)
MSKNLILYGASNPTTLKILSALNRDRIQWNLRGFLDDAKDKGAEFYGYPILGNHAELAALDTRTIFFFNNVFGSMAARRKVSSILHDNGCLFTNLVSPCVDLSLVEIGVGVAIEQLVAIDAYARIGNHSCVKRLASIGHETVLDDFVFVGPGATICGRVRVGEGSYLGAGCVVRNGIEIGSDCVVGAGAVVVKSVRSGTTVVGNPASLLKRVKG